MNGELIKKWMQENNLKEGIIHDLYIGHTIEGEEEKINYSDILLKKRIKCRSFYLSYIYYDGLYDTLHENPAQYRMDEKSFLKYAKSELKKYKEWYKKESYPEVKEVEITIKKDAQLKLF